GISEPVYGRTDGQVCALLVAGDVDTVYLQRVCAPPVLTCWRSRSSSLSGAAGAGRRKMPTASRAASCCLVYDLCPGETPTIGSEVNIDLTPVALEVSVDAERYPMWALYARGI